MTDTTQPPLDLAAMVLNGQMPPPPISMLIGMTFGKAEVGRVEMHLQTGPQHYNPRGTVHGGIFCDIADAAMGMAFATTLEPGETFTTIELKINYLKPVWESKLTAIGTVVRRGRTISLTECEIYDEGGSLVAKASSTLMALRGEMAKGR